MNAADGTGRARERLTDAALACGVLALGLPSLETSSGTGRLVIALLLALALAAAMFARRSRPLAVVVVVTLLTATQFPLGLAATPVFGVLAAVWSLALYRERAASIPAAVASGTLCAGLAAGYAERGMLAAAALVASLVCAAWALGAYSRVQRQVMVGLREKAEQLERDRHLQAAAAVAQERARIMREMHDGLGHALSVIAVQSAGARSILGRDPERAGAAMDQVVDVARAALAEMRGIVRAERDGRGAEHLPRPDLTQLDSLVSAARSGGTDVSVAVAGDVASLPPARSAAGFRVIQEALTNVRKHAGPQALARVEVEIHAGALDVIVGGRRASPARSLPPYPGTRQESESAEPGTGLVSMRERVSLLGGSLSHGWHGDGEFVVRAVIPADGTAGPR